MKQTTASLGLPSGVYLLPSCPISLFCFCESSKDRLGSTRLLPSSFFKPVLEIQRISASNKLGKCAVPELDSLHSWASQHGHGDQISSFCFSLSLTFFFFLTFFDTKSQYLALAGLELAM